MLLVVFCGFWCLLLGVLLGDLYSGKLFRPVFGGNFWLSAKTRALGSLWLIGIVLSV